MSQQWQPPQQPQQAWQQQPSRYPAPGPGPRPPRRRDPGTVIAFVIGGAIAVIVVIAVVAASHHGSPRPSAGAAGAAAPPAASSPAAPAQASKVTFVVTGSPAQVTYGDTGSNAQGSVPMRETMPLGNPLYYSINAQLNGSGKVSCQIIIGGKVISFATASGGYNIAMCEASKDPLTGQWKDTTKGI